MTKEVQIGPDTYIIPENLDEGYGQELSDYLVAVGDTLNDLQGVNDITLTTSAIDNNQSAFTSIQGLLFDTGTVKTFSAPYFIVRTSDISGTIVESGTLHGAYDGSTWSLIVNDVQQGADVVFSITAGGQVQYKSSEIAITATYSGQIKFKAKTLDT